MARSSKKHTNSDVISKLLGHNKSIKTSSKSRRKTRKQRKKRRRERSRSESRAKVDLAFFDNFIILSVLTILATYTVGYHKYNMEKKLSNGQKEEIKVLVDKLKNEENLNKLLMLSSNRNRKENRDLKKELDKAKKAKTVGDIWTWVTNVCKSKKKKTV